MPEYRFTTDNGRKIDKDDEPLLFKDDKAAADAAQEALADMAKEQLPDGNRLDLAASVDKEDGDHVYHASLTFKGETADQARVAEAEDRAAADEATEKIIRPLSPDKK